MTGWQDRERTWWDLLMRYGGFAGLVWNVVVDHFEHPYALPLWAAMMGLSIGGFLPERKKDDE